MIDLNVRDPEQEAEEPFADRVVAHILKQNTAWTCAGHLRDVQRLWELWCEGAETLHERAQQVPGKQKKAQSGREQVRLKTQRRRAAAPIADEGTNHRTRRLLKLARQDEDLVKQRHRHAHQAGGLGVCHGLTALQHDARWDIVRHCRFPSLEQLCRLAADLREEARQAYEDDREKLMTT